MILVVNAGSSSVKAALFAPDLTEVTRLMVSTIGGNAALSHDGQTRPVEAPDHATAITLIRQALGERPVNAAAHRVVHGGETLTAPTRLTPDALAQIRACVPLAPLHNPPALAAIDALAASDPALPQYASFDTAFHAGQPPVATTYALPERIRARGIRRYGFHGLSYAGLVRQIAPLPDRLLALHLGAGVSLCAIHQGRSVATSMGYSPLSGPTMATRPGDIDAGAVLRLAEEDGIAATANMLNRESGLLGLSGISADMRALLADPAPPAAFAVAHFCYWAARQAGSLIAAMGGIDALAFTGGIGENSPVIRDRITALLLWAGKVPVHVIPAREEEQIARDALALIHDA
ncbi:MAG: acetate kinase [Limimaricola sp.]|uniref:acetate/propionate family kinase n=1 Tax=Limimaricola sp. TaxID=2211665 RepID=UPI001DFD9394|nr:acetate kinase [Limimaricola sp.]MBI1417549.1 acetate kinase [Limimaricola sp.]